MIAMAKGRCVSLPIACERAAGTSPRSASEVVRTGLKASCAPLARGRRRRGGGRRYARTRGRRRAPPGRAARRSRRRWRRKFAHGAEARDTPTTARRPMHVMRASVRSGGSCPRMPTIAGMRAERPPRRFIARAWFSNSAAPGEVRALRRAPRRPPRAGPPPRCPLEVAPAHVELHRHEAREVLAPDGGAPDATSARATSASVARCSPSPTTSRAGPRAPPRVRAAASVTIEALLALPHLRGDGAAEGDVDHALDVVDGESAAREGGAVEHDAHLRRLARHVHREVGDAGHAREALADLLGGAGRRVEVLACTSPPPAR